MRGKSKTDLFWNYCKSSRWEGVVDYYVAIIKNEKKYNEKLFNIYLICKASAYF